ncbi:short-chain dehydrogenase [Tsuneonella deserti]|uniref:Short-chain dehydrogenase n=1 Tax=Tsuneonella deserti TaxID=2035528 RepID=A0ABQ1SCR4_9SPHN|nr:NnrS family protein [Tsuneonella deserti]GGE00330.1 short-chain dehydrogenase [Tsuneonella deserti]
MQTRGEQMLALRRSRMASAPAILRGGFRPFFLGGAVWAVVVLALWLTALAGAITLPTAFDPLAWHRHEMLFGFVGAIVSGFLLTAIPNWTGRLPIAGPPLLALFAVWLAGRIAVFCSSRVGMAPAAVVDVVFYLVLVALALREVLAAKNRNVPIVGVVFLFGVANALDHAIGMGAIADDGLGWRSGLSLVVVMISLIGGRIIPSFTRNWLVKQGVREGLPGQPTRFDLAAIGVTATALAAWVVLPDNVVTGDLLALAAALQFARLARWKGWRTVSDPLVIILHIGYLWVPVGLALLAASIFDPMILRSAAVHALTAGAMATMILAVMTRATLGHTGRELRAGPATVALYLFVCLGAVLRVTAPLGLIDYTLGMEVSAVFWGGAFLVFLAAYGPILFAPRLGEKA